MEITSQRWRFVSRPKRLGKSVVGAGYVLELEVKGRKKVQITFLLCRSVFLLLLE